MSGIQSSYQMSGTQNSYQMSGTLEMAHLQNQKCPEMALEVALKKTCKNGKLKYSKHRKKLS